MRLREALTLGHNYVGTEHLLLGVARENQGVAARILLDFDADAETIRSEVIRRLSGPRPRSGVRHRTIEALGSDGVGVSYGPGDWPFGMSRTPLIVADRPRRDRVSDRAPGRLLHLGLAVDSRRDAAAAQTVSRPGRDRRGARRGRGARAGRRGRRRSAVSPGASWAGAATESSSSSTSSTAPGRSSCSARPSASGPVDVDLGDIVGVTGVATKTKRGEPSLAVDELELLAKIAQPLPDTYHGLVDAETRYRKRYLDLLVNEETRAGLPRPQPHGLGAPAPPRRRTASSRSRRRCSSRATAGRSPSRSSPTRTSSTRISTSASRPSSTSSA